MFTRIGLVEALDLRNGTLTLRSHQILKTGQETKVRVQVPPGTGKVLTVPVEILSEKSTKSAGFIYRAKVKMDLSPYEFRGNDPILRDVIRFEVNLRARAKELPDFRATVNDFSRTGAQLQVARPVAKGLKFPLHLDLDGFRQSTVSVAAEVVWVETKGENHFCGVRFLPKDPQEERLLGEVADFVARRAGFGLEQLLDEAKRLEPHAPIYYDRTPAAAPKPAEEAAAPAVAPAAAPVSSTIESGLMLPVGARLDGYSRNLASGSFFLRFQTADDQLHTLEFPDCQIVRDLHTAQCAQAAHLSSRTESDWLRSESPRLGPGVWKHYACLAEDRQILLELISRPLRG